VGTGIREAPALELIDSLLGMGATISAFDPEAMDNVKQILGDKIEFASSLYEATQGADFLIIATEWPEFRTPDFEKLSAGLKDKVIFDGRNVFDLDSMVKKGFQYYSIGRRDLK
jgi:UDPglucose 6-dehydrogenase